MKMNECKFDFWLLNNSISSAMNNWA